jgi:hypothetical protein
MELLPLGGATIPTTMSPIDGSSKHHSPKFPGPRSNTREGPTLRFVSFGYYSGFSHFLVIPIGRAPRHGGSWWPIGAGVTVALPFLHRISSALRGAGVFVHPRLTAGEKG